MLDFQVSNDSKAAVIKYFAVSLGLVSVYMHQWIGIILMLSFFAVDFVLARVKTDAFGRVTVFKIFLLLQGLFIWSMSASSLAVLSGVNQATDVTSHMVANLYADNVVCIFSSSNFVFRLVLIKMICRLVILCMRTMGVKCTLLGLLVKYRTLRKIYPLTNMVQLCLYHL